MVHNGSDDRRDKTQHRRGNCGSESNFVLDVLCSIEFLDGDHAQESSPTRHREDPEETKESGTDPFVPSCDNLEIGRRHEVTTFDPVTQREGHTQMNDQTHAQTNECRNREFLTRDHEIQQVIGFMDFAIETSPESKLNDPVGIILVRRDGERRSIPDRTQGQNRGDNRENKDAKTEPREERLEERHVLNNRFSWSCLN